MKLVLLAEHTSSTIERGDADLDIRSTAGLDIAGPGDITFLANPKYKPQIAETRASAIFSRSFMGSSASETMLLKVDRWPAGFSEITAFAAAARASASVF